jgi:hypothetical protein
LKTHWHILGMRENLAYMYTAIEQSLTQRSSTYIAYAAA